MPSASRTVRRVGARLGTYGRLVPVALSGKIRVGDARQSVPSVLAIDPLARHACMADREPLKPRLIGALLDRSGSSSFVDVGANAGQTLLALLDQPVRARYWGFEPQAEAVASLQRFIELNRLEGFRVFPFALSDADGFLQLHRNRPSDTTASLDPGFRPDAYHGSSLTVPVFEGDPLFERLGIDDISLMKVDVEGAELEVLRGLERALRRDRPTILFEVLPNWLFTTGEPLAAEIIEYRAEKNDQLSQHFAELGYELFSLHGTTLTRRERITPEHSDRQDYNWVAIHAERLSELSAVLTSSGFSLSGQPGS